MEKTPVYNVGVSVAKMVDELPAGLDRAVLRILSFHVGRQTAISRADLVRSVAQHGFAVHERALRAMINQLRKAGHLICSTGGEDGGYWLAANHDELNEFCEREFHSRAMDLLESEQAMKQRAEKMWGIYSTAKQERLNI